MRTWPGLFAVLALGGCVSLASEENAAHLDVYFTAARECEWRNLTVHVERVFQNGDLAIFTDQDTRIEVSRFITCYHEGIQRHAEALRKAGRSIPKSTSTEQGADIDENTRGPRRAAGLSGTPRSERRTGPAQGAARQG